jgi:hypothetical protein
MFFLWIRPQDFQAENHKDVTGWLATVIGVFWLALQRNQSVVEA